MALDARLREGSLINWESIRENKNEPFFRHRSPDCGNEKHKEEAESTARDLELSSVAYEIGDAFSTRIKNKNRQIGDGKSKIPYYFSSFAAAETFKWPFVEKEAIIQLHDAVEELKDREGLLDKVDGSFTLLEEQSTELNALFERGEISFLEFEKRIMEANAVLGTALNRTDSGLLKDLSDVFQSHKWSRSPLGDYYLIVGSQQVKARVDNNGFQLFAEARDVAVDNTDQSSFTSDNLFVQKVMHGSIQRRRAYDLLGGSKIFLAYLVGLASWAEQESLVKPTFNDSGEVSITGGYHPLLKSLRRKTNGRIVKHNTKLESGNKVVAITGPNLGGKSTYIKEFALISVLAQSGSFVPAKSANLPIYKKFLTHFGGEEDILKNLSLFRSEIKSLNRVLRRMGPSTLLVCDELFRGTESGEKGGARLHEAVVEALVHDYNGRTVLSSHYHESLARQQHLPNIQFKRVEVDRSGKPKYTIVEGVDKGGYCVQAAIRSGLHKRVIARLNGNGRDSK